MQNLFKIAAILLLGTCSVQNMKAQKIQKLNGKNVINPYYSRTDTKVLKIPNSAWKKVLNTNLYLVSRLNETEIDLTSHEFELLWLLASHAGQVLSRQYIYQLLLNIDFDGKDRKIDVRISRLRKKLNDNIETPFRIKTVWGQGYLFAPEAWNN